MAVQPGLCQTWLETQKTGYLIRPYFFQYLVYGFFFQNIKVGGGKKIKIKITKKNLLFNLKHILDRRKKNNKNCKILHCKYAEMTILLSFLHFISVKSYNFCYFFLACCQGSKPVLESFSDIQCVFLEDSRRHCIFL